ncbi:hypothetical protein ACWECC_33445 [Streptomyces microflavus]
MTPYRHPSQPRPSGALDELRELAHDADLIKIRANPKNWSQAEVLATYDWGPGPHQATPVPNSHPDDSPHAGLVIGEFLDRNRNLPVVTQLRASESAYTFMVRLSRPIWSDDEY